jgi:response regulator RpfG family c-di-GMP phosphodiesterase
MAEHRRVLFVDDEPYVLDALVRNLSEEFEVTTATSGVQALETLATNERGFSVIVSDMRMPEMTGAVLLAKARDTHPEVVRILLTGETDVQSAIAAVNEGEIYRYLTKPCPNALLKKALETAVAHHALIRAERELLEGTLRGVVKVMSDVLALVSPGVFARATRLKSLVAHAARQLKLENQWVFEVAALLSPIGCIALPDDLVSRVFAGQEVTDAERAAFATHPETAFRLLADIPRCDKVAAIIRAQRVAGKLEPRASGDAPLAELDDVVTTGVSLLCAAVEIEARVSAGATHKGAVFELKTTHFPLSPRVLSAFETYRAGTDGDAVRGLPVAQLAVGMICDEDVLAMSGSVIVPKGTELGGLTLERLRKFALGIGVREPVRVRIHG